MKPYQQRLTLLLGVGAFLTNPARGACPNACSGHGTCGDFDSCVCYSNWEGGDCSQRTCPYHFSWITTSKGDINYDGDTDDLTMYDGDHYFTVGGAPYVTSQQFPGGDWEKWPSYFNPMGVDEGHFYMECSNRGTCDRSTGICNCFDGYTGDACRRTNCPNDCSGNGQCKTVNDQKGATAYTLWDGDMSRSCVCDPGFTGPACSERVCPVGDDPLTTDQHYETQYVEIYADYVDASTDQTFAGNIRLSYTDNKGQTWTTDQIAVEPYLGVDTTVDTDTADALNNLPNNALSGVTVTEGWCQQAIAGTHSLVVTTNVWAAGTTDGTAYTPSSGDIVRCDSVTSASSTVYRFGGTTALQDYTDTGYVVAGTEDDLTCYILPHLQCIRLAITFASTPGDVSDLVVDTSGVTISGSTTAQGAQNIGSSVSDSLQISVSDATFGVKAEFTDPSTITATCTVGVTTCALSGDTTVGLDNTDAFFFGVGEKIQISCDGTDYGTYTVAAVGSGTSITVTENTPACAATSTLLVTSASYVIHVDGDLTEIVNVGDRLDIDTFASVTVEVASVDYDLNRDTDYSYNGRIILSGAHVGDDAGDEAVTDGANLLNVYSTGTTEANECSDRGICNTETGLCQCFKGYTGAACSTQNALAG